MGDTTGVHFAELTYEEVRERAAAGALVVVPTGCTEQQGPHLPVGFDTWFAETVAIAAAEAVREHGVPVLVLPALPFGPTPEHRNYGAGYIDLPPEVHELILRSVLASLGEQGFRHIVVWRGCGGHDLSTPVADFNRAFSGRAQAHLPELPYHAIWYEIGDRANPGGHADAFATSMALYLRPDSVRRERIARSPQTAVDWDDKDLDFTRYSASGVIGDPTGASAELGKRLWTEVVRETSGLLHRLSQG